MIRPALGNRVVRRTVAAVAVVAALAGCVGTHQRAVPAESLAVPTAGYSKVLVVMEENETYESVVGSRSAPYISELARTYASATNLQSGYPATCPSLAAYVLLTSGSTHGICDDLPPAQHKLGGDNVFAQVVRSGRQWRTYAESMPSRCARTDSADGRYAVRHNPAVYFTSLERQCAASVVPMGTLRAGALHDDLARGTLPALSMVVPNICNDMHGGEPCSGDRIRAGDDWLAALLPTVFTGPDYRAGRLLVIVAWDEGTSTSNHVPLLVIGPTAKRPITTPGSLCSVLRTISDVLAVPPLGCAGSPLGTLTGE